jgi:transposase
MYTRVSRQKDKGKTYEYLQLCEAYRNRQGQPRTRVLMNFGRLDHLDRSKIDAAVEALLAYSTNPKITRASDLEHTSARDYGDMLALVHLWARLRLTDSISGHLRDKKVCFDVAELIKVMVLNRLSDPLSKLGVMRWLPTVYIPDLKQQEVSYAHLLRAMDYLVEIKEQVERDLYNELVSLFNLQVEVVFMDLTSCYFEGEGPEMAAWGYSRDRRPDRQQIVLALVVSKEGLPLYHEVLPGNTADVTTLVPTVQVLKSRFRIGRCILVCDRGMVSEQNLAYLDEHEIPYIVAIRRRGTRESDELIAKSLRGFVEMEELGLRVKEKTRGDVRYILCHNPEVAKRKKESREAFFKKAQGEIDKLNRRFRKGQISPPSLYHKAMAVLEHYHLERYFSPEVEKRGVILYTDTDLLERERFLEGKFFLKTRLTPEQLSTAEAIRTYKALSEIERAFRTLKDPLRLRPIFHWTDRRVKAHVMICVLAYLLQKVMGIYCQRARLNLSAQRALSVLSQLKAIRSLLGNQSVLLTTTIEERMREILDAAQIPIPEKVIQSQLFT